MKKVKRKIIKIDEELCDGCGNCIPACPEQALQIVETENGKKARLVKELYCDGLGACLGNCPTGALSIIEDEVEPYDDEATIQRIKESAPEMLETHIKHMQEHGHASHAQHKHTATHACPSAKVMQWEKAEQKGEKVGRIDSQLRQWPVQIHLVPAAAPYFKNADIVFVADCVPFSYANLHQDFIKGKAVAVGCPKFDDADAYIEKITNIIRQSQPKSLTVVTMEVPCCSGLVSIVKQAIQQSGSDLPLKTVIVTIKGEIKNE
ncbi:MAG: 4Fe-4S dicluster domain-containing protein [candidate division WOR-3 bacterium]|nr:MAG: 4Fe-4S dicluster domain-containing protein [candidate division WOR-3 bacterium]